MTHSEMLRTLSDLQETPLKAKAGRKLLLAEIRQARVSLQDVLRARLLLGAGIREGGDSRPNE